MIPEEIKAKLAEFPRMRPPLVATSIPTIFRGQWESLKNGGRMCQIGTFTWKPIITTAYQNPGDSEENAMSEAIARIEGHGKEGKILNA